MENYTKNNIKSIANNIVKGKKLPYFIIFENINKICGFNISKESITENDPNSFIIDYNKKEVFLNEIYNTIPKVNYVASMAIGHIKLSLQDEGIYHHLREKVNNNIDIKDSILNYFSENLLLPDIEVMNIYEKYKHVLERRESNPYEKLSNFYNISTWLFYKRFNDVLNIEY